MSCAVPQPGQNYPRLGSEPRNLPRDLKGFRGYHEGESIVVCGCGASLRQLVSPERFITIGVNDVGRLFEPDYLVVLNPRQQFRGDRFRFVEESRAQAIFTHLDLGIRHSHIVRFRLGKFGGADFSDPNSLHYTRNSPYLAVCLAAHMGAKRIGLIGVDFTDDHFFARTGQHPLTREFAQIDREYKALYDSCARSGIELVNLSEQSRLSGIPKISPEEFAGAERSKQSLQVVSYATTPVAGVPAILARCIASCTPHQARTVWATNSYGNGVTFEGDVEWRTSSSEARELLQSADVIIAHNGKIDPSHRPLLADKAVITMAHNYMWNVDSSIVNRGFPGVVVGQYQATLPEFKGWKVVPNPIPLWEEDFQPGLKNSQLTISYTPYGKHEFFPAGHRLYWHSKGYVTTMRVLERLAQRFNIRLEVIRDGQVSHAESLAMKRRAHIVIDECVTGSYHRNSLEGLALGCVVVNGLGRVPPILEMFRTCSGSNAEIPFVYAGLDDLERVLTSLLDQGTAALVAQGQRNRHWMEQHWDFQRQWEYFWQPVVSNAIQSRQPKEAEIMSSVAMVERPGTKCGAVTQPLLTRGARTGLSVVVCHGGRDRLPHLGATLANLRQCQGVAEIIVVDMGSSPFAEETARRWVDKYIFVRNDGLFERARSLNIGTTLAEYDLILWLDNDLIMPPDFISKAIAEMRATQLDYLIPYTRIDCLSEADSKIVMQGGRNPADCPAAQVFIPLQPAYGAAGILKRSFVITYGGMSEEFRGWGGEDDAWWHKVKLLGRSGVTRQRDQRLYHLFHAYSGSYVKQKESNPHYDRNVAALKDIWSAGDRDTFLKRFPPQAQIIPCWQNKRVAFVSRDAGPESFSSALARCLTAVAPMQICWTPPNTYSAWQDLSGLDQLDAVVIDGTALALPFLADENQSAVWQKAIVIHRGDELNEEIVQSLRRAGAIVCTQASDAGALRKARLRPFTPDEVGESPANSAMALLQPLSIIMGGHQPSRITESDSSLEIRISASSVSEKRSHPPVWMYWEGVCPEWIKQCQQTAFKHAPSVRLLSRDDFEKLRDIDRDIELEHLHVAQRADYVRAFLLAKYGGLWIDSDCIVMRSIEPLLDILREYDFIAHRERATGFWANDFMGAAPGSRIAAALYRKVCDALRSHAPIEWTALGCIAVTETLKTANTSWFAIKSERVQPVCWSNPAPFFAFKDAAGHEQVFDQGAVCYMLSNLTMQKKMERADLSQELLREGTFFSYLISKALHAGTSSKASPEPKAIEVSDLGTSQPAADVFHKMTMFCTQAGYESKSGPGSALLSTAEIRQRLPLLMQNLRVHSILDAGCGDFNWMKHVRLAVEEYIGVDVVPQLIIENRKSFAAPNHSFMTLDISRHSLPKADLILCRDCLVHLSFGDIFKALENFKESGARYFLATTFDNHAANDDLAAGNWRPLNLRRPPFDFPEPLRIMNEKCQEGGGAYSDKSLALWRMEDIPASMPYAKTTTVKVDNSIPPMATEPGEPYELAVIVPISVGRGQDVRLRNMKACLQALNSQDLERKRYRIIVVEQDSEPRLDPATVALADRYIFSYNPGAFNKGWALNIGVSAAASATNALCLMDADMLSSLSLLRSGLTAMRSSQRALRPYTQVTYLDSSSTESAIQDRVAPAGVFFENRYRGRTFQKSPGGCIWVEPKLYRQIGGFDERFRGFGYEDAEFWDRLSKYAEIKILPGTLFHMHHPPSIDGKYSSANALLYDQVTKGRIPVWTGPMGNIHRYFCESHELENRANGHSRNGHAGPSGEAMVQVFAQMARRCSVAGYESLSGPGSSLSQTDEIRRMLPSLIREIGARSLLDAPCGDFNWMRQVVLGVEQYIGIDVLPAIVEQNQRNFTEVGRRFVKLDITRDTLPESDLIFCRDCLVHFSYQDIDEAIRNFKKSRSRFILTTTFPDCRTNKDIATGDWRPLNFQLYPFNFPPPLKIINEKCSENGGRYADKSLALWELSMLP